MKLTDEQIHRLINNIPESGIKMGDIHDTIEALQQENKQLQAQAAGMREALEEATETIENIYEKDTPQTEKYRDILNVGTTEYHNPADVALLQSQERTIRAYCENIVEYMAALAKAREALGACMDAFETFVPNRHMEQAKVEVREALAAIGEIGGKEDA